MELDIFNLFALLAFAWLAGQLATRLGYPSILGELLIGIIIGPPLLGWLESSEGINILAEVGVLLMMLYIGVEIDYRELKKASWAGFLAAIGGFITPFVLGYYTVVWFGGSTISGLFVAIAVGVTSLATKSRILVDLKLLDTRIAHVLMAGALISDTLALVVFAGIISLADIGTLEMSQIMVVSGKAVGFFAVTFLIGKYLLPFLGKKLEASRFNNRTLYFTMMILVAFLFAELAELAGLHHILGTFIAGLFLRNSVFNRKLSKELNGVFYDVSIGFLAPIFFVMAGFQVTFDVFTTDLPLLLIVIAVATFGKIIGTTLFYIPSGHGWREGLTVGAGMNGRGAVEIIIAGIGLRMGIISQEIFSILVFMALFTTATVPILLTLCTNWLKKRGELVRSDDERKGILVVGAGPIPRLVAKELSKLQPVWLVDSNKELCQLARQEGLNVYNGNALKEEDLSEANAASASTFVGFTTNSEINILSAQLAKEIFLIPNIHVLLTLSEGLATTRLLEPINASTLFAKKVDIIDWERIIEKKAYTFERMVMEEKKIPKRLFLELLHEYGNLLPLIIYKKDGNAEIFHYEAEINPGDEVVYLSPNFPNSQTR